MMDHLLNAQVMFPPVPRALKPGAWVVNQVPRRATIATMPQWMRKMAGLRQGRLVDAAVTPVMRLNFAVLARSPRLAVRLLPMLSPSTVAVAGPVLLGIPPRRPEVVTPAQARERHGILPPPEEYARFRSLIDAKLAAGDGAADEVVLAKEAGEFEEVLGPVA